MTSRLSLLAAALAALVAAAPACATHIELAGTLAPEQAVQANDLMAFETIGLMVFDTTGLTTVATLDQIAIERIDLMASLDGGAAALARLPDDAWLAGCCGGPRAAATATVDDGHPAVPGIVAAGLLAALLARRGKGGQGAFAQPPD